MAFIWPTLLAFISEATPNAESPGRRRQLVCGLPTTCLVSRQLVCGLRQDSNVVNECPRIPKWAQCYLMSDDFPKTKS